jgi:hypothetical protein
LGTISEQLKLEELGEVCCVGGNIDEDGFGSNNCSKF